eukprot:TRINITY_DN13606_c0_g1_i2.p2 TRINITY_DN13606_c0_g1~~TRINITY_DN13606_c0_g1_i2.p2  ORF type:complete len:100 (-),score=13.21 TRINITY_DN13606_c0_g1_i2:768-1067(-)
MVLTPSHSTFMSLMAGNQKPADFDMDVVNNVLGDRIYRLPSRYAYLNGVLADKYPLNGSNLNGCGVTLRKPSDLFRDGCYIHFTSVGKPWARDIGYLNQ